MNLNFRPHLSFSCLELLYPPPLDSKRRNLPTKIPLPTALTSSSKPRNSQKAKGTNKLVDNRPPAPAKLLPNGEEPGSTSSSEGEKDSPPEWDSVPVHKPGSCKYGDLGISPCVTTLQGHLTLYGDPVSGLLEQAHTSQHWLLSGLPGVNLL